MPTWETEDRKPAKASLKPPQRAKRETVGGVPVRQLVAVATHAPAAVLHPVQPKPASTSARRAPSTPSRTTAPQATRVRGGAQPRTPVPVHASTALRPSTAAQPVASRGTPRAQPNHALSQLHHRAGRVVMEPPHHSEVALHPGQQHRQVAAVARPASHRISHHGGGGILGELEHVGSEVVHRVEQAPKVVQRTTEEATHVVLDIAAVLPYAEYYGAYETAKAINALGKRGGTAGSIVSHLLASPLTALELQGLLGDVVIDLLKGESIHDEQGPPRYVNPLHSFVPAGLRGPRMHLPGIGEHGIDFQW